MKKALIRARNIHKEYVLQAETVKAVKGVDLEVREGDFVSLMGPSGSGKTTLLDVLGGLTCVTSGKLEVLGQDISNASEDVLVQLRRKGIGFVFQDFLLIPTLTAEENVNLALYLSRKALGAGQAERALKRVGLGHRLQHRPAQLSGGERQRVAMARALVTDPALLLADEPTGNLDSATAETLYALLMDLNEKDGLTVLLATHNDSLGRMASRILQMKDGCIREGGA